MHCVCNLEIASFIRSPSLLWASASLTTLYARLVAILAHQVTEVNTPMLIYSLS
jgi:hypothetical protein